MLLVGQYSLGTIWSVWPMAIEMIPYKMLNLLDSLNMVTLGLLVEMNGSIINPEQSCVAVSR